MIENNEEEMMKLTQYNKTKRRISTQAATNETINRSPTAKK